MSSPAGADDAYVNSDAISCDLERGRTSRRRDPGI